MDASIIICYTEICFTFENIPLSMNIPLGVTLGQFF